MRLLLLTGELAASRVEEEATRIRRLGYEAEVLVLGIKVASLMSVRWLRRALQPYRGLLGKYDLVVLPGYTMGSASELEEEFGIRFVKGTKHICDLAHALKHLSPSDLSPEAPADLLLREALDPGARLEELEASLEDFIEVGEVRVPVRPPPMRVISEIYYGPGVSLEDLLHECERRLGAGADIICLGLKDPASVGLGELRRILRPLRDLAPSLALDDPLPGHVGEGLRLGVDLILSITQENLSHLRSLDPDAAYVLVPPAGRSASEKISILKEMALELEEAGVRKILLDPLLMPPVEPGLFESLKAYDLLRGEIPDRPLLMGLCNAVEFLDADSPGVIACLTALAGELGVSTLLITEESPKTYGATGEASSAAKMVSLALGGRKQPKDLGVDLLVLKEKTRRELGLPPSFLRGARPVECEDRPLGGRLDPLGFFRISLDRRSRRILAFYEGRRGRLLLKGATARAILGKVLELGLISTEEHLAYLALELGKAEIALRVGRSYVQDEPLFQE